MPSWRARIIPVWTSPLRRPSRTSSRCRCRVAVPQPSGRSPAEIVISRAHRAAWRTANAIPTMPPSDAPTNVTGCVQPMPSSQLATRSARPSTLSDAIATSGSSNPRQVEPLPGQHGHSTVCRSGSIRSAARIAGHHASRSSPPNGNGDAVIPPTTITTGAVPSSGP
jgi:hypothetical protein